jgi:hypothetical protein
MAKLTPTQARAVTAFTVAYIDQELAANGRVEFGALRSAIHAKFPGAEFNWMTVVRSPMQAAINAGKMHRDTTNIAGPELYVK